MNLGWETYEDPLFERAFKISKMKPNPNVHWGIKFIREWERICAILKGDNNESKNN